MKSKITIVAVLLCIFCQGLFAQVPLVYTQENTGSAFPAPPLPAFNQLTPIVPLPDPFMWSNGSGRSTNFADWERRRNEIKAEIENYEIGRKPNRPETITATYTPNANPATGTLRVIVTVNGQSLTLTSAVSLPTGPGPFAAIIGMNSASGSVPASVFTSRNIARITYSHNNVTTYGSPRNTDPFYRLYPDQNIDNSGQYAAWAWGLSRLIDGLELVQATLPIDLKHIGVTGCSYAGKMALYCGAFDERVALTIAQESGGGGAPAWRVSETLGGVEKLGNTDYNWFKEDMRQFAGADNVSKMPHDHHELMAMIAPRALLITGNTDVQWLANPSAYVSSRAAHEVWKTFGVPDRFGFYIDGGHGHCAIPASQVPALEVFVDKFLAGNTNANTNVTFHPFPQVNYQRWIEWWGTGNPQLPAEPPGIQKWMEAECAIVGSDWDIISDPLTSSGKYATVKAGLQSTGSAPANASGHIVFPFTIDSAGNYNFVARINGPTPNDDSYWVRVDNGAWVSLNGLTTAGWEWAILANDVSLTVGAHTFTVGYREDGAGLDKVLITTSYATVPAMGSDANNCAYNRFIPGKIEAENYSAKAGPFYWIPTTDEGGGQKVVGITNGSWMDYNVTVVQPGYYSAKFRVATTKNNSQFQIKSGDNVLATINIPNTGEWNIWKTVSVDNIPLAAGMQTIRIQSTNNENADFNWTQWDLTGPPKNFIPGKIEAEDYATKSGPLYWIPTTDAGGGQKVVGITNGSWMDYTGFVTQTGTYSVKFRVATTKNNSQFQIKSGNTILGTINIPNTGEWNNWMTVSLDKIPLTAGVQTIRIQSTNNENCDFNWTEWVLTGPQTTAPAASGKAVAIQAISGEEIITRAGIGVFPNPVTNQFTLQVDNDQQGTMKVQIFDQNGRSVKALQLFKNKGAQRSTISAAGLSAGVYTIRLQVGDWISTEKMIKL
ncbi:MAG: carbohydrate-binding protein [Chitinophagaceae bacterium]